MKEIPWKTAPISPTCERLKAPMRDAHEKPILCDEPTEICYPAMGGGWMALCKKCGEKHLKAGASRVSLLINRGETFQGTSREEMARL